MSKKTKNILNCLCLCFIIYSGLALCIFMPKAEYSQSERRELKDFPELSVSSIFKGRFMKEFEEYASDSFPFRDSFRSIKAYFSRYVLNQKDNNNVYVFEDSISSMDYPYNKSSVEHAAQRFGHIRDTYLSNSRVFLSVIPDKNVFLSEKAGVLSYDADILVKDIRELMPYAQYIDIFPFLSQEDYYKTDSHWKQEKIQDVAQALAENMGVTLSESREEIKSSLPFYGVYYGQAALKLPADTISYLKSDATDKLKAFDYQNNKAIPVYDTQRLKGRDPYELFLSGPLSLVTVENPAVKDKRELIIFRDSFASAIAPLIAEGYSKVTLIDIRYTPADYIRDKVSYENADVLFLYSTTVLNNSETLK